QCRRIGAPGRHRLQRQWPDLAAELRLHLRPDGRGLRSELISRIYHKNGSFRWRPDRDAAIGSGLCREGERPPSPDYPEGPTMIRPSLAIFFSIIASAPLYAAAPQQSGTRTIVLADLNLASAAGRAQLQRRIDRAVTGVCGRIVHTELRA